MNTRSLARIFAVVAAVGLLIPLARAQEGQRTAQVAAHLIQINGQTPTGAQLLADLEHRLAELSAMNGAGAKQPTEPGQPTNSAAREEAPAFNAVVADSAALFGDILASARKHADDPQAAPCRLIAAPRIAALLGQEASMTIGREVPYMVQRPDGSLVVERNKDLVEGVTLRVTVTAPPAADDEAKPHCLIDLHLRISRVTGRQPLAGVPFDVGSPIVASQEIATKMLMAPGASAVLRLPQPGQENQPIFMLLAVTLSDKK
ncbi:MAG: type II and III secretion system protein [Planctomycetes bacterium]|nr:type II and III secretion system protein [Planctomycetota bacterium]